jgi:hypothetical protein
MTDQQLDDLERLLKERDEAMAALDAFLAGHTSAGPSITIGPMGVEYRRLSGASWQADWRYEASLAEAGPALIAEVRRLRTEVARHAKLAGDVVAREVERLKADAELWHAATLGREQIIAELDAEVERLKAALRDIADMWVVGECDDWVGIASRMSSRAEEALEGPKS